MGCFSASSRYDFLKISVIKKVDVENKFAQDILSGRIVRTFLIAKYFNIGICQVTVVKYLHHFFFFILYLSRSRSLFLTLSIKILFTSQGTYFMKYDREREKCYSITNDSPKSRSSFAKITYSPNIIGL